MSKMSLNKIMISHLPTQTHIYNIEICLLLMQRTYTKNHVRTNMTKPLLSL